MQYKTGFSLSVAFFGFCSESVWSFVATCCVRSQQMGMDVEELLERLDEEAKGQLKSEKTLESVDRMSTEERLGMAAIYLCDAQARRDISFVRWESKGARGAYRLHKSAAYSKLIRVLIYVYALIR